jgi:hypothetical protein
MTNDCFCCEGTSVATPERIDNRAGLTEIDCRVGTHSSFKESMLARLSDSRLEALRALLTRDDDDFSIALCDACSSMLDVLTFYNERIAQENYLRSATERRSMVRLAHLIGYRPHPGLAAHTYLAFTVDDSDTGPESVRIPAGMPAQSIPGQDELPQTFQTDEDVEVRPEWNSLQVRMTQPQEFGRRVSDVYFTGLNLQLNEGDYLLFTTVFGARQLRRIVRSEEFPEDGVTKIRLDEDLQGIENGSSTVDANNTTVYVFRQQAAFFGHNAPDWNSMTLEFRQNYPDYTERAPEWPGFEIPDLTSTIDLDKQYGFITQETPIAVMDDESNLQFYEVAGTRDGSRAEFSLSARVTVLRFGGDQDFSDFADKRRLSTILCQAEKLQLAEKPWYEFVHRSTIHLAQRVPGLHKGQKLAIFGRIFKGPDWSEVVEIDSVRLDSSLRTVIELKRGTKSSYVRATVEINANVVRATHGESVLEAFSGDARLPELRVKLKQGPLTYVGSEVSVNGVESTLEVRVDGIRWQEVPNLYAAEEGKRIFRTQALDEETTAIQFGKQNRPGTGQENIAASYRKGIGSDGLVAAGSVSLLPARPLGVRDVTNIIAGTDAQDPESSEDIQANAPLTVLTLDRLVSLKDHEDFARAFGGIAKALATWTWDDERRGIFLTVAGTDGAAVPAVDPEDLGTRLYAAMTRYSIPFVPLTVRSYRSATFRLAAKLVVDPDYIVDTVLAEVRRSLIDSYAFAERRLGYPVAVSEVVSVMHDHPGVRAVDVDSFFRTEGWPILQSILPADAPRRAARDGTLRGAELLTIDPDGISLRVRR